MEFSPSITLHCLFSIAGGAFLPTTMQSSLCDIITYMAQSPNWPSLYVHNAVHLLYTFEKYITNARLDWKEK